MPQMPPLHATDIAWVAGVIDSRGHIEIALRHDHLQPRLSVTTRRLELLAVLSRLTGVRVAADDRGYERRPCVDHCGHAHQQVRQSAKWRVDSARATIVLYNIRPYVRSQVAEVTRALEVGMERWPAARGNTGTNMEALGWRLPPGLAT